MTDPKTVTLVVVFLGVTVLACVIGGFWLAASDTVVPDYLVGLGGTALGALGALLARTGNTDQAQNVNVVNQRDEPVPVDPA